MLRRYRLLVGSTLLLVLSTGSLGAAAVRPLRVPPRANTPAGGIQGFFTDLWQEVVRRLEKSGSGIDPFGHPAPTSGTQTSSGDSGSGIDPFGGK
jgi:hypothetical protein